MIFHILLLSDRISWNEDIDSSLSKKKKGLILQSTFGSLIFLFRGVGYPSLWPSKDCQQPLDVSNEFTFKVIDSILSGNSLVHP